MRRGACGGALADVCLARPRAQHVDTGRGTFATNYTVGVAGWWLSLSCVFAFQYLSPDKRLRRLTCALGLFCLAGGMAFFADGIAQDHAPDNTGARIGWEIVARVASILRGCFIATFVVLTRELLALQPAFACLASRNGARGAGEGSGAAWAASRGMFVVMLGAGLLAGFIPALIDVVQPDPEHGLLNAVILAVACLLLLGALAKALATKGRSVLFFCGFVFMPIMFIIGMAVQLALRDKCAHFMAHDLGDCPLVETFNHNALGSLFAASGMAVLVLPIACLCSQAMEDKRRVDKGDMDPTVPKLVTSSSSKAKIGLAAPALALQRITVAPALSASAAASAATAPSGASLTPVPAAKPPPPLNREGSHEQVKQASTKAARSNKSEEGRARGTRSTERQGASPKSADAIEFLAGK